MPLMDPLTRQGAMIMQTVDLAKITDGLRPAWAGYLRDWDRSLRAGNYPATTRYNCLLAAARLGPFLGRALPAPDTDAADEPAGSSSAAPRDARPTAQPADRGPLPMAIRP